MYNQDFYIYMYTVLSCIGVVASTSSVFQSQVVFEDFAFYITVVVTFIRQSHDWSYNK
jgi:hypothetical protein